MGIWIGKSSKLKIVLAWELATYAALGLQTAKSTFCVGWRGISERYCNFSYVRSRF